MGDGRSTMQHDSAANFSHLHSPIILYTASTSSGVNGIFLPNRRAPVSVIK